MADPEREPGIMDRVLGVFMLDLFLLSPPPLGGERGLSPLTSPPCRGCSYLPQRVEVYNF